MPEIITTTNDDGPKRLDPDGIEIELGWWYWVKFTERRRVVEDEDEETDEEELEEEDDEEDEEEEAEEPEYEDHEYEHICCVTHVGTNYVEMSYPSGHDYARKHRIHFREFFTRCRRIANPAEVLHGYVREWQQESHRLMTEIQQTCLRLGVSPGKLRIAMAEEAAPDAGGYALATLNAQIDVEQYKADLIKAKDTELPQLFRDLKEANSEIGRWMNAETLPLRAQHKAMESVIGVIEGRIFNVELYAGLVENIATVTDGEPAPYGTKLHVYQQRLYMDEESLLDYQHGGLEFDNIHDFDAWLARPQNRDRILPYPRTLVAFRVRRNRKYRGGLDISPFLQFELEKADERTFLYIRNGEKLFRLSTSLDFGRKLFPSKQLFASGKPLRAKLTHSDKVEEFITEDDYQERLKKTRKAHKKAVERNRLFEEWKEANPGVGYEKSPYWKGRSLWSVESDLRELENEWRPFDDSSVFFDDMVAAIEEEVQQYNRIALIIQGLHDRSEVLHPHPPVQLWEGNGFDDALVLVRQDRSLHKGPMPDLEAYIEGLNEQLKEGCVTIGQQDFWEFKEAEKENARRDRDWRDRGNYRPERWRPVGNPGPGRLARIAKWKPRARKATYRWTRERQTSTWEANYGDPIPVSIEVPDSELFNVDAYKLGDFRRFFEDPRTRAKYMEWAPMLLLAEEYHAGFRWLRGEAQHASDMPDALLHVLGRRMVGKNYKNTVHWALSKMGVDYEVEDIAPVTERLAEAGFKPCAKCRVWIGGETHKCDPKDLEDDVETYHIID